MIFIYRECFPDSFVLFKPKDIVSGDFYFFSRQEDLIIFAAVDCTGHGIPGALLSTLVMEYLDQAVNEIKLTEPSLDFASSVFTRYTGFYEMIQTEQVFRMIWILFFVALDHQNQYP